jgi:hypothetical protein
MRSIGFIFLGVIISCLVSGCGSAPGVTGEELVADSARNSQRIEDIGRSFISTIDRSAERLDAVRGTAESIRDIGTRLEFIIDQYDYEMAVLRNEINNLRKQLQAGAPDSTGTGDRIRPADPLEDSGGDITR